MHVSFRCWCVAHTLLLVPCVHLKIVINVTVTSQLNRSSQFTTKFINRLHFIIVMCLHIKKNAYNMHPNSILYNSTCLRGSFTIFHCLLHLFIIEKQILSIIAFRIYAQAHSTDQTTGQHPNKKQNAKKATQPLKKNAV